MYHYTTGKNSNIALISIYYEGFHSERYDPYFDDLANSHRDYATSNNMDYICFNGDLLPEVGVSINFANGCVGIMKWYAAWHCLEALGYDDVMVVDIDAKFVKSDLQLSETVRNSALAVSMPYYWHFTDAAWVMYALYRDGATVEQLDSLKLWYNTGTFKVNKSTNFKPYLDRYVALINAVYEETTGLMSKTQLTKFHKHRIMAPYDEGFLQYFIAFSGTLPDKFPSGYNMGIMNERTVLFHFTDKSLIPKYCNPGNTLLHHSEK